MFVHLTETSAQSQGFNVDGNGNNQFPQSNPNFGGRGSQFIGRGGRFGGRFRGHFGGNVGGRAYVQYQICSKIGHDASYCHFRFSTF